MGAGWPGEVGGEADSYGEQGVADEDRSVVVTPGNSAALQKR
jgi:hypothetical protein